LGANSDHRSQSVFGLGILVLNQSNIKLQKSFYVTALAARQISTVAGSIRLHEVKMKTT